MSGHRAHLLVGLPLNRALAGILARCVAPGVLAGQQRSLSAVCWLCAVAMRQAAVDKGGLLSVAKRLLVQIQRVSERAKCRYAGALAAHCRFRHSSSQQTPRPPAWTYCDSRRPVPAGLRLTSLTDAQCILLRLQRDGRTGTAKPRNAVLRVTTVAFFWQHVPAAFILEAGEDLSDPHFQGGTP